jgi:hypothetical protein
MVHKSSLSGNVCVADNAGGWRGMGVMFLAIVGAGYSLLPDSLNNTANLKIRRTVKEDLFFAPLRFSLFCSLLSYTGVIKMFCTRKSNRLLFYWLE